MVMESSVMANIDEICFLTNQIQLPESFDYLSPNNPFSQEELISAIL